MRVLWEPWNPVTHGPVARSTLSQIEKAKERYARAQADVWLASLRQPVKRRREVYRIALEVARTVFDRMDESTILFTLTTRKPS